MLKTACLQKMLATIITITTNTLLVLYMFVIEHFLWVSFLLTLFVQLGELGK